MVLRLLLGPRGGLAPSTVPKIMLVPRARRENHYAAFLKVPYRAPPDERLGHLMHFNGALHTREDAFLLERTLQRQRIDHCGQHAHVIARSAVDFKTLLPSAAADISAAHHDGDFHAQRVHVLQLARDSLDCLAMDSESLRPLQ